jgi:hypothetical protein
MFSRVISVAMHPLLMPLYMLLLLLNLNSFISHTLPVTHKLTLSGMVLLTTVIFPLFLTWMLKRLGLISSYQMPGREERVYPILAVSVFYYLTYYLLKEVPVSAIFSYYMLGATLLAILSFSINFFGKVSLHMIGIGSLTGLFVGLTLNFGINLNAEILGGILLAGIIGFARLREGAHKPAESYSGFAMGVLVMAVLMMVV